MAFTELYSNTGARVTTIKRATIFIAAAMSLCACSITVSQNIPNPTVSGASTSAAQFDNSTDINGSTDEFELTPRPSRTNLAVTQAKTTGVVSDAKIELTDLTPTSTLVATPVIVDTLGLSGKIMFTQATGLWQINMTDGKLTQLWEPPKGSYLSGLTNSPYGDQLVLAYAPPPSDGRPQIGRTGLYITDKSCINDANDCGDNLSVFLQRNADQTFTSPYWSPDGKWVYYSHQEDSLDDVGNYIGFSMSLNRLQVQGNGIPEILIPYAGQPSMSVDGSLLTYVSYDLETYARGLWVSEPDGSNPRQVVPNNIFGAISGPQISPDGSEIAFAASAMPMANKFDGLSWLDILLGVRKASAHGWRWEIWKVPTIGGDPVQLTRLRLDSPWPAWSPVGGDLAILRLGGVYLLRDGEALLLAPALGHGQLVWCC